MFRNSDLFCVPKEIGPDEFEIQTKWVREFKCHNYEIRVNEINPKILKGYEEKGYFPFSEREEIEEPRSGNCRTKDTSHFTSYRRSPWYRIEKRNRWHMAEVLELI